MITARAACRNDATHTKFISVNACRQEPTQEVIHTMLPVKLYSNLQPLFRMLALLEVQTCQ